MKHLIYSLTFSAALLADEKQKTPPQLNTAEAIALNAVDSRMKAIRDEYDALEKQRIQVRADACRRALDVPMCEIRPDGKLAKLETAKKDEPKK